MVAHAYNLNNWEEEAGESDAQTQHAVRKANLQTYILHGYTRGRAGQG